MSAEESQTKKKGWNFGRFDEIGAEIFATSKVVSPKTLLVLRGVTMVFLIFTLIRELILNVERKDGDVLAGIGNFFKFLTNQVFTLATIWTATSFIISYQYFHKVHIRGDHPFIKITWLHKLHWVGWEFVWSLSLAVTVLFWGLLIPAIGYDAINDFFYAYVGHGVHSVLLAVDLYVNRIPFQTAHVWVCLGYFALYAMQLVIYHAVTDEWIYSVAALDQPSAFYVYPGAFLLMSGAFFLGSWVAKWRDGKYGGEEADAAVLKAHHAEEDKEAAAVAAGEAEADQV